jgi:hypothetical protein
MDFTVVIVSGVAAPGRPRACRATPQADPADKHQLDTGSRAPALGGPVRYALLIEHDQVGVGARTHDPSITQAEASCRQARHAADRLLKAEQTHLPAAVTEHARKPRPHRRG